MASVQEMKDELQALIDQASPLLEAMQHDAVRVASETGRLDLLSALMAVVGLSLVMVGIFAFGYFRGQAYAIAKKTAEEVAEERLTALLRNIEQRMEDHKKMLGAEKTPSSRPSVAGAQKATEKAEFEDDKE